MEVYSPIALFVFARPEHTRRTLEALSRNPEAAASVLYIYADAAPADASPELCAEVNEVRRVVRERSWCGNVIIVEAESNRGLADSIVAGIDAALEKHGRIIVLEDDIVVESGFLRYMNEALRLYEADFRVMQISGYCYPIHGAPVNKTYFLRAMSCWGWATWERAWRFYSADARRHLEYWTSLPDRGRSFDLDGCGDYLDQLRENADGRRKTWAVKWFSSWMKAGGLCLYPGGSLAQNIGHDATGENCGRTDCYSSPVCSDLLPARIRITEDSRRRRALARFYRKYVTSYRNYPGVGARIANWCSKFMPLGKVRNLIWRLLLKIQPGFRVMERDGFRYYYDSMVLDSKREETSHVSFPCHLESSTVGRYSYIAQGAWIFRTDIGGFCSIGPNFSCGWGTHPLNGISTAPMFYSKGRQNGMTLSNEDKVVETGRIRIGSDVFIGMNVTVLDGVSIGDGAVIGAGAVVSKDVPPYAVAVGNPLRILRYRFDEATRERLLRLQWWKWDLEKLQQVESFFFDVEGFLEAQENEAGMEHGGNRAMGNNR